MKYFKIGFNKNYITTSNYFESESKSKNQSHIFWMNFR